MVKDLEMLVALIFLFIGVFFIFNARGIVRNKLLKKIKDENKAVYLFKVFGYLIIVVTLLLIYYFIKV